MGFRVGFCVGVAMGCGAFIAPVAVADPAPAPPGPAPAKVSCKVLDELQESYDDDIDAGLGGLRIVWGQWGGRLPNSKDKLQILSHGVHYLQNIDSEAHVPGLAPIVSRLEGSLDDLRDSVDSLTTHVNGSWSSYGDSYGGGSWSPGYDTLRNPAEGDWAALDDADDQAQALLDLVDKLRSQGCASPQS